MADHETSWTWNFSGPTTESKAQSRNVLPREVAWELTGVDGNSVGGLRTHPGFITTGASFNTDAETLVNFFPVTVLTSSTAFVYGFIYFTQVSGSPGSTYAYLVMTSDGVNWSTSTVSGDLTWSGNQHEITVECMGRFIYVFVRGESPKTINVTSVAPVTYSVLTGGPGPAPVVKVISTTTEDNYADYLDNTKQPAGSRTTPAPSYPQEMHVYRVGGAQTDASVGSGADGTAVLLGNTVDSVTVTNYGSRYTGAAPSVTFSGGGGSGAAATAVLGYNPTLGPLNPISWGVRSVNVTSPGSGYTSAPTVEFGGPATFGSGIRFPTGTYNFAVQYMSTTTGRKSVISNIQTLQIGVTASGTTPAVGTSEYIRLKVRGFGVEGEYDRALIYRSVKNAGEGGTLHLEKTLVMPAQSNVSNAVLTSNVVTITTSAAHGLQAYDYVTIAGATNNVYDGSFQIVSVPSTTTFTYAKTNTNVGGAASAGTVTLKVRNYDVEVPDMELVYLDVYVDRGILDKTMPKGSVAAFMGSTLFVSRIGGTDTAEPGGITPMSPPRSVGDMRWSSTGEIQPENFKPSNRWIPKTMGNEIIGMKGVGNYMMAFSSDRVYRVGRAGQFIKVEEMHMGYGLVGRDALEGVGGMVYFVSGGGMKAISASGQIDDVSGLDALVNKLWLGAKGSLQMSFDAYSQCLTIMKPSTYVNGVQIANGAAACMWFGTSRVTELVDLPFQFMKSGYYKGNRRSFFVKRISSTSWGVYVVDADRSAPNTNLCGGAARHLTKTDLSVGGDNRSEEEYDCAIYPISGTYAGVKQTFSSFTDAMGLGSVAPMVVRWVGGDMGLTSIPGQPEFKDFFKQKQISSCDAYFDVLGQATFNSVLVGPGSWRALAYKGSSEVPFYVAVPLLPSGANFNVFGNGGTTDPAQFRSAPFGRHGVIGSSLSVGFQCDIVGADINLLGFSATGRVLDTDRRHA